MLSLVAGLCVSSIVLAQNAPTVETVLTLPQEANGQTENITEGPDGAIYVTAAFDRILWRIKDGKAEKFFASPAHAVISGVAWDRDELVVNALDKSPFSPRVEGQRGFTLNKEIGSQALILDKSGKVTATVAGRETQLFNGLARAVKLEVVSETPGHRARQPQVVSLVTRRRPTIETWLQDPRAIANQRHEGRTSAPGRI